MSTNANPMNRVLVIQTIEDLFYEKRNARRNHKRAYDLFIYPLYGICEESTRNYRKNKEAKEKACPLTDHLKNMLRLDIEVVKYFPLAEAGKFLHWVCERVAAAIRRMKEDNAPFTAAALIEYLTRQEK